ncbi:MAG TPA: STAS domain-containing protein [Methanothrix sp.]|nr:STAS domain-containing protein [Methanothrix sp.]HPJ83548.1 STAS domain-containing protein [Methanothrix sp.]HPR66214.1 STAS domain-containing protein [Methanothrix sp.]
MKIDDKSSGDVKIVSPAGRLDASSSEELKARMEGLIGDGCRKMVLNFDGVEYISSSGLRVMLASLKQLRKTGGDLKLASLKPYVRETFEIAGFTQLFEIYDGEDEAVAEFGK